MKGTTKKYFWGQEKYSNEGQIANDF